MVDDRVILAGAIPAAISRWPLMLAWDGWRGACGHDEQSSFRFLCWQSFILAAILLLALSFRSHRCGSKNFTESFVLGELWHSRLRPILHLKVERRFYLAGTYICQQAIFAGRIDVYPEYTGTALTAILKEQASNDRQMSISG